MNISDEQLEILYTTAFPQVASLIGRMGGDLDTAKDLFHDALIIFMEKQQQENFVQSGSRTSYLVGITKMLWYQHLRTQVIDFGMNAESISDTSPVHEQDGDTEQIQELHHQLKQSGEKCLDLLTAYYYEKKSLDEIATELHYKNVRSATVQKYKCIEKLRTQMKKNWLHEIAA